MSNSALPMLFFNLGGEMLYVLDQRLRAQNVPQSKGKKVMADIVRTMFSKHFMEELFKPQTMYSRHAMRTMFDRLVHSSIMRVDSDSMEKLYDLMLMAFKFQIIKCQIPRDLLHITLNHLDAILQFVSGSSEVSKLVTEVFTKTVDLYENSSFGELVMIRQSLLTFLQDSRNKVSIFVNSNLQNPNGTFVISKSGSVPFGSDVPGKMSYYEDKIIEKFTSGCTFNPHAVTDSVSTSIGGKRMTKLGSNLYASDYNCEQVIKQDTYHTSNQNLAKAELSLLGHLMGGKKVVSGEYFELNLFCDATEDVPRAHGSHISAQPQKNVISIEAVKSGSEELTKIMQDFNISTSKNDNCSDAEDLLTLMDSV